MFMSGDMTHQKMTYEEFQVYHAPEIEALYAMFNEDLTAGQTDLADFVDFCYTNTSLERPRDFREAMTEFYEIEQTG